MTPFSVEIPGWVLATMALSLLSLWIAGHAVVARLIADRPRWHAHPETVLISAPKWTHRVPGHPTPHSVHRRVRERLATVEVHWR